MSQQRGKNLDKVLGIAHKISWLTTYFFKVKQSISNCKAITLRKAKRNAFYRMWQDLCHENKVDHADWELLDAISSYLLWKSQHDGTLYFKFY